MTGEEAIDLLENLIGMVEDNHDSDYDEALKMGIKALEQEPVLDKIRTEIIDTLYVDSLIFGELIDFKDGKISADDVIEEFNRVTGNEVLQIIDEYREGSE